MNSLARSFQSASNQFIANADPEVLSPRVRALVVASALVLVSSMSMLPSAHAQNGYVWGNGGKSTPAQNAPAQAGYVWGNGGKNAVSQTDQAGQEKKPSVVSEKTINRWGEILGGVIGRVAGASVAGSASTSVIGRSAQDAVTSMSEEAGRNIGRSVVANPVAANPSVATVTKSMPLVESDQIDTAGLNAAFAYALAADLVASGRRDEQQSWPVFAARERTMREFDLAIRNSSSRGFPIAQWTQVRSMLEQPVGVMSAAQLTTQAQMMSDRLFRAGGPGYRIPSSFITTTTQDRSVNMQNRNQATQSAAAPQQSSY